MSHLSEPSTFPSCVPLPYPSEVGVWTARDLTGYPSAVESARRYIDRENLRRQRAAEARPLRLAVLATWVLAVFVSIAFWTALGSVVMQAANHLIARAVR